MTLESFRPAFRCRTAPSMAALGGAALGLAAALVWPAAPASAQTFVPAQSEIVFTSRQMGVPVDGRFRRFDVKAAFDPKKPEAAKLEISVDMASAQIGTAEIEAELAKPDWFDSARITTATFRSSAVRALAPGRYEVTGTFTLKGNSRPLTVPVTWTQSGDAGTAEGQFAIRRLDFGIGGGEWKDPSLVADEVRVRFRVRLAGVAAP